jgi:CheY-like chemotaxis protein
VVLDVMMPKMSGVDVLDSLEALTSDPSVKTLDDPPAVLVITAAERVALPDAAIIQRSPRMVQRVFRKPLDVAELAACVEKYLRVTSSPSIR